MARSVEEARAANTASQRRVRAAAKAAAQAKRTPVVETKTCAEFAEKHIELIAASSATPGPFSPWAWQKSWLEIGFLPEDGPQGAPRSVTIQKCARAGWTKCIVAIAAYGIVKGHNSLILQPRQKDAQDFSADTLMPTLDDCFGEEAHFGLGWTSERMMIRAKPGAPAKDAKTVKVRHSVSPDLRRIQCFFALGDEISAYSESPGEHGRLLERLTNRVRDSRGRILQGSTPTTKQDLLSQAIHSADLIFDWSWCCPSCDTWQPFEWERVSADGLACVECGEVHAETVIREAPARWQAVDGRYIEDDGITLSEGRWPRAIGYRINALAIDTLGGDNWADLQEDCRRASKSPSAMITFRNEILGLHVGFSGRLVAADELMEQSMTLTSDPERCRTVGVDVGRDALFAVLVEWAEDETAYIFDYAVIAGDTDQPGKGAWPALVAKVQRWGGVSGILIDSGYHGDGAYDIARNRPNWRPFKGLARPIERGGLYKVSRQRDKGNAELIVGDTAQAKSILLTHRLSDERKTWYYFDNQLEPSFYHGLLAEEMQVVKGRAKWVKVQDDNEPIDCLCYAFLAQRWLKSHRYWRPGSAEQQRVPRRKVVRAIGWD